MRQIKKGDEIIVNIGKSSIFKKLNPFYYLIIFNIIGIFLAFINSAFVRVQGYEFYLFVPVYCISASLLHYVLYWENVKQNLIYYTIWILLYLVILISVILGLSANTILWI